MSRGHAAAGLLAVLAALAGCREHRKPDDAGALVNPGPLPTYEAVATGYNTNLVGLDHLRSYAGVRFWYTDEEGKEHTDALDGSLQIVLPSRLSLRLDKVNNTVALLGSNEERYWWIEMGDSPRALWGMHASVSGERLRRLGREGGVPVHPLDVVDMLGITPLPAAGGVGVGDQPAMEWSKDGRSVLVTVPCRGSRRRLWVDPKAFRASRIELLGREMEGGPEVIGSAELSGYVPVEAVSVQRPVVPGEVVLTLPEARVRLRIESPTLTGRRIRPEAFDLDWLLKFYKVDDVRSLDERGAEPGPRAEKGP